MITYLSLAIRRLRSQKLFSVLNIFGLAIGMAASVIILLFVRFEHSYDKFHSQYDEIYRLTYHRASETGESVHFASCAPPAGLRVREQFPQVDQLARFLRYKTTLSYGDIIFFEEKLFFAESQFLEIFDFNIIKGASSKALDEQGSMFITQASASKYFGEEDPIGRSLELDKEMIFTIVGVIEDVPDNSHLKFDFLLSWPDVKNIYGPEFEEAWGHTGVFTYLTFKKEANIESFRAQLSDLIEEENGEMLKYYKLTMDLPLQTMKEIHLDSHYMQEHEQNGDRSRVNFLLIVAFFIIFIAWMNYVVLSTAQSSDRASEIGLRKINGAHRKNIIQQLLSETAILNTIAFFVSLFILILGQTLLGSIIGISNSESIIVNTPALLWLALLFMGGIFLAGLYPSLIISISKPAIALKGKQSSTRLNGMVRKVLVIGQNFISLTLLTCTLLVFLQHAHLKNSDTGVFTENVIAIKAPRVRSTSYNSIQHTFFESLRNMNPITKVASVSEVPGRQLYWDAGGIFRVGSDQSKNYQIIGTDYEYLDLFEIEITAGRNFSKEFSTDSSALILNEKAIYWMGFDSISAAIGSEVNYWGDIYHIIGIVADFHQQSVKYETEPTIIRFLPEGNRYRGNFVIRSSTPLSSDFLKQIEEMFLSFFPGNPFEYYYVDDYYDQQFENDQVLNRIFWIFSIITVMINILGVIGLTAYMVSMEKKNISIRKVLGNSSLGIIKLFSMKFLFLIIISSLLSIPLSWFLIQKWLITFASQIHPGVILFLIPLLGTLIYTMTTVILLVYKESVAEPVKNLRYE
jgi:putative ABC transport system permease protein